MKKHLHITVLLLLSFFLNGFSQEYDTYKGVTIEANYIIIKFNETLLKSETQPSESSDRIEFAELLSKIGAGELNQMFPNAYIPENCEDCVDLTKVFDFHYTQDVNISYVLKTLNNFDFIEYAEPNRVAEALFVPDDTKYSTLWYLSTCKILQSWDIQTGDTNVVIGITDTGFDLDHIDLIDQIKYNYADPNDGIDNDYDGYIDNYKGWDFGNNDKNPNVDGSSFEQDHGTIVAGVACAKVNNAFATAGVGYNCKFLPIKIAVNGTALTKGYHGIVYAADHGCSIINCSWGTAGYEAYSKFEEDVINYATFNRNALVVAAAGNHGLNEVYYPATYRHTLSVGGSQKTDQKWSADNSVSSTLSSNYNYFVDLIAPAVDFYSTSQDDNTTRLFGGTSYASPLTAGIAALVKSEYPDLTALELGERLCATTKDVYGIPYNVPYNNLLGSGRVDAYEALTNTTKPSIKLLDYTAVNSNGNYLYYPGDTLELSIDFKNYLADATNVFISVSWESSYLAPITSTVLFPSINKGQVVSTSLPLTFEIVETMPSDVSTFFKVTCSATDYFGYEYFPISFNPSYYNFEFGNIKSTATSNGTIGVLNFKSDVEYGFIYKDYPSAIIEGSLLIKKPGYPAAARAREHNDFTIQKFPTLLTADSVDLLVESKYINSDMNINIDEYVYGWENKDVLIHEYRLTQMDDSVFHDVRAGIFVDWAILGVNRYGTDLYDKVEYLDSLQMAYIYTPDPTGFYIGVLPLHYHQSNIYAIDENDPFDAVSLTGGFTDYEIEFALTNPKYFAGESFLVGSAVSTISSIYLPELFPDSTVTMRYAFVAAESFDELVEAAYDVQKNYVTDTTTPPDVHDNISELEQDGIFITTSKNIIDINIKDGQNTQIKICNAVGKEVYVKKMHTNKNVSIDISKYASGLYIIYIEHNKKQYSHPIIVNK